MSAKGYLPHHAIKAFAFWITTICLVVATASSILYQWGAITELVENRCLWTAFTLAVGSLGFLMINYIFGNIGDLFADRTEPPGCDPAFSERLKSVKMGNPSRGPLTGTDE